MSEALNLDYEYGGHAWHISTSIGISFAPKQGTQFVHLYEKADAALYETKKNGKNGFTFYSESKNDRNE